MKNLLLLLPLICLISCSTLGLGGQEEGMATDTRQPPTELEGPAYDPGESPAVMTPNTTLPGEGTMTSRSAEGPATYGSAEAGVSAPVAYGSQPMQAKGGDVMTLSPAEAAIAPTLDGDWYNADDQREVVRFTPTHYTTFYDGELIVEEEMHYHATCPTDCTGGQPSEFACFTIDGPGGSTCYGVIRLTDQIMELSMLGVSTETIVYRKLR